MFLLVVFILLWHEKYLVYRFFMCLLIPSSSEFRCKKTARSGVLTAVMSAVKTIR